MTDHEELEIHAVDLDLPAACTRQPQCARFTDRIRERLVGRLIGAGETFPHQEVAAVIALRDHTPETFERLVRRRYKGNAVRDGRKSLKAGFRVEPFVRKVFLADVVEVNTSKEERTGRPMRDSYLRTVEELGGAAATYSEPSPPPCPVHWDQWWGVFRDDPGRTQGTLTVDKQLLAYIDLRRVGELAIYSYIIGHGDYLSDGVMFHLHFELMRRMLGDDAPDTQGLGALMYAGFHQGGHGLVLWKKKAGFSPGLLVTSA